MVEFLFSSVALFAAVGKIQVTLHGADVDIDNDNTVLINAKTYERTFEMKIKKISELITKAIKGKSHVRFTVGMLKDGNITTKLYNSNGETDYISYSYEIGSIAKVFTAALLAKYLQTGEMNLTDSISEYFPNLNDGKCYPTIQRLATHNSGYSPLLPMTISEVLFKLAPKQIWNNFITKKKVVITGSEFMYMDYPKMISIIEKKDLKDKDYTWSYSNFGIAVLGQVISCVAKKDFSLLMNEFLLHDLSLKNTSITSTPPNAVQGYDDNNLAYEPKDNPFKDLRNLMLPAGAITSTPEDMLQFIKVNLDTNHAYSNYTHNIYGNKVDFRDPSSGRTMQFKMGLAWFNDCTNPNIYFHEGNIDGFSSVIAFDKVNNVGVVLLMNYHNYKERDELWRVILETL